MDNDCDEVLATLAEWHAWATRYTREHAHAFITAVQAGDFIEADRILAVADGGID